MERSEVLIYLNPNRPDEYFWISRESVVIDALDISGCILDKIEKILMGGPTKIFGGVAPNIF